MPDPILTTLGLLMIACAITLLVQGPRSWIVAFAQGVGLQAVIGGLAAAVHVGFFAGADGPRTIVDRVSSAVERLCASAAGWTAQEAHEAVATGASHPLLGQVQGDPLVLVSVAQLGLVGLMFAVLRAGEHERAWDPLQFMLGLMLVVNAAAGVARAAGAV